MFGVGRIVLHRCGAAHHLLCTWAFKDSSAAVLGITVACDASGQNWNHSPSVFNMYDAGMELH